MLNTLNSEILKTKKKLEKHLRALGLSKKKILNLLKIYTQKHEINNLEKVVDEYFLLVKSFDQPQTNATTYKQIDFWSHYFESSGSLFMGRLASTLIALKTKNRAKLKRSVEKLMALNPIQVSSEFDRFSFGNAKMYNTFVIKIMKTIDLIEEGLGDRKLTQILSAHLSFIIKEKAFLDFARDKEANWNLSEIQANLDSYSYGRRFPGAWLWRLQGGVLLEEREKFLKESLSADNIFNVEDSDLWILKFHFPLEEKLRVKIIKRIINNWKRSSYTFKQIVIDLIQVPIIKKLLSDKRRHFKKPSFTIERNFYNDALANGKIIERSIFHLLRLGERNNDFIWWLAL